MFPLIHIIMLKLLSHRNGRRLRLTKYWNQEMNFHNNMSSHCSGKARWFFFHQITLKLCRATAQTNMGNLNEHERCLRKAHWKSIALFLQLVIVFPAVFRSYHFFFPTFPLLKIDFFSYTIFWLHSLHPQLFWDPPQLSSHPRNHHLYLFL